MFACDVTSSARRQALEFRSAAEAFLIEGSHAPGTPAAKLDAVLQAAPAWVISRLSFGLFEERCYTPLEQAAARAMAELSVDPVAYAASGVGLRTFLRMYAGAISNAEALAETIEQDVARTEARLDGEAPKTRALSRRFLNERGKREFGLQDAMSIWRGQVMKAQRETQTPLPPLYGARDRIECPDGRTLRIPSVKETRLLARAWEDGWASLSPENAMSERSSLVTGRLQAAAGLREAGRLLGVYENGVLVGNLVVNRVSETQAEIGWFTMPGHRGRGVATAATEGLLADLRGRGIEEVGAQCFPDNAASLRVIAKLGLAPLPDQIPVEGAIEWVSFAGRTDAFAHDAGPSLPIP